VSPRERVVSFLLEHPWAKLFSLLLAGAIWFYVQGEEIADARVRAEVEWQLPPGVMSVEPLPTQVAVTIRGSRVATRRARDVPVRIVVDLRDAGVGEHGVDLSTATPQGLPAGIEVLAVAPNAVRFLLDEVTTRRAAVSAVLVGEPAEGFEISEVTLAPEVVEVRGPRSAIAGLDTIRTQPIDVSGITGTGSRQVVLDLPRGVTLEGLAPVAQVDVRSRRERRVIEDVPVHVRGYWSWRPEPDTVDVTLEGRASALLDVSADEVVAVVVVPEGSARQAFDAWWGPRDGVRLEVLHPEGMDAAAVQPPSVHVTRP
jgi:YbbR domain-containing protein